MSQIDFTKIQEAQNAGFSLGDILTVMGESDPRISAARDAGFSDNDIFTIMQEMQPKPEPVKPEQGDTIRGLSTAFKQVPQLGYGLVAGAGMLAESAFGEGGVSTDLKEYGVRKYKEASDAIEKDSKLSDSLTYSWDLAQQGDMGALVDWLQYGIGYGGGQIAQALVTGGVGALAGRATLKEIAERAASGMVSKEIARITATEEGKSLTKEQLAKVAVANTAANIGSMVGVGAQAFGMEGGEIFGGLAEQTSEDGRSANGAELLKAFAATAAAGGLEFITDKMGVDLVKGKSLFKVADAAIGATGKAARMATGAAVQMPAEAGTEYLQTGLEAWGQGEESNPLSFMQSEQGRKNAIDAAGMGAIGGGIPAVVGGALSKPTPHPVSPSEIPTDPIQLTQPILQARTAQELAAAVEQIASLPTGTEDVTLAQLPVIDAPLDNPQGITLIDDIEGLINGATGQAAEVAAQGGQGTGIDAGGGLGDAGLLGVGNATGPFDQPAGGIPPGSGAPALAGAPGVQPAIAPDLITQPTENTSEPTPTKTIAPEAQQQEAPAASATDVKLPRALTQEQATNAARSLTRQGFETVVIEHPVEKGKFAAVRPDEVAQFSGKVASFPEKVGGGEAAPALPQAANRAQLAQQANDNLPSVQKSAGHLGFIKATENDPVVKELVARQDGKLGIADVGKAIDGETGNRFTRSLMADTPENRAKLSAELGVVADAPKAPATMDRKNGKLHFSNMPVAEIRAAVVDLKLPLEVTERNGQVVVKTTDGSAVLLRHANQLRDATVGKTVKPAKKREYSGNLKNDLDLMAPGLYEEIKRGGDGEANDASWGDVSLIAEALRDDHGYMLPHGDGKEAADALRELIRQHSSGSPILSERRRLEQEQEGISKQDRDQARKLAEEYGIRWHVRRHEDVLADLEAAIAQAVERESAAASKLSQTAQAAGVSEEAISAIMDSEADVLDGTRDQMVKMWRKIGARLQEKIDEQGSLSASERSQAADPDGEGSGVGASAAREAERPEFGLDSYDIEEQRRAAEQAEQRRLADEEAAAAEERRAQAAKDQADVNRKLAEQPFEFGVGSKEAKSPTRDMFSEPPPAAAKTDNTTPPSGGVSVSGTGAFGDIYSGLTDQPEKAIDHLMRIKGGEVPDAYTHKELGPIAFVYGDAKMGLRHIAEKRGMGFLNRIPDLLRNGRLERDQQGLSRAYIVDAADPANVAVLRLDWDGSQKTWLVTAYPDEWGKFGEPGSQEAYREATVGDSRVPESPGNSNIAQATNEGEFDGSTEADQNAAETPQNLDIESSIYDVAKGQTVTVNGKIAETGAVSEIKNFDAVEAVKMLRQDIEALDALRICIGG